MLFIGLETRVLGTALIPVYGFNFHCKSLFTGSVSIAELPFVFVMLIIVHLIEKFLLIY